MKIPFLPFLLQKIFPVRAFRTLGFLVLFGFARHACAQIGYTPLLDASVKTLQLKVNGENQVLPVIQLNSTDRLEISFDCLTHEYQRLSYQIEHCDYLGRVSEGLFESDYLYSVSDEEVIEDYEYSTNTTVLYTHYVLELPNTRMRPLISGNYRLSIYRENDEGDKEPIVQTYFGVLDAQVLIRPAFTTNTDRDWNDRHQQLSVEVACQALQLRDAADEIKLVVMQNRRIDHAVFAPKPTAQNGNTVIWEHCRDLIFPAGNEYRKFEMLSTRYPGMHGDYVRWFDPYYHYVLLEDEPRRHFIFDKDNNGACVIRCEDTATPETEADYVLTHFTLRSPYLPGKQIYVDGGWTCGGYDSAQQMTYHEETACYEASVLLKLGYYNYQYLCVDEGNPQGPGETFPIEGDYYQTENQYDILVYYAPAGGRCQELVGFLTPIYKP